jgi:hypothetical protein
MLFRSVEGLLEAHHEFVVAMCVRAVARLFPGHLCVKSFLPLVAQVPAVRSGLLRLLRQGLLLGRENCLWSGWSLLAETGG